MEIFSRRNSDTDFGVKVSVRNLGWNQKLTDRIFVSGFAQVGQNFLNVPLLVEQPGRSWTDWNSTESDGDIPTLLFEQFHTMAGIHTSHEFIEHLFPVMAFQAS